MTGQVPSPDEERMCCLVLANQSVIIYGEKEKKKKKKKEKKEKKKKKKKEKEKKKKKKKEEGKKPKRVFFLANTATCPGMSAWHGESVNFAHGEVPERPTKWPGRSTGRQKSGDRV